MGTYPFHDRPPLVAVTRDGMYCAAGDFHIDPWRPVERALITHAHGDHARTGSQRYLAAEPGLPLLRKRLGDVALQTLPYGERLDINGVTVSFHSAGHVLGSAQIRLEHRGEVWVVSGDYKRTPDPTCAPFEVVRCDTFITEATFGLPIYRWDDPRLVAKDVLSWWEGNRAAGKASVLFCYALGKAQRLLAHLGELSDGYAWVHGAVDALVAVYREAGVPMLRTQRVSDADKANAFHGALVLAPPSAAGSPWLRRFGDYETGFASGWMRVRGNRRRRGFDRGFVLSDHADWPELLQTVHETGASRVLVTHGSSEQLARYLKEKGADAAPLATPFEGEAED